MSDRPWDQRLLDWIADDGRRKIEHRPLSRSPERIVFAFIFYAALIAFAVLTHLWGAGVAVLMGAGVFVAREVRQRHRE